MGLRLIVTNLIKRFLQFTILFITSNVTKKTMQVSEIGAVISKQIWRDLGAIP